MPADADTRLCDYVSRLLGSRATPGQRVALSSGQMARVLAWADAERIGLDPANSDRHGFLLATADGIAAEVSPVPRIPAMANGGTPAAAIGIDIQLIDEVIPPFGDPKAVPELLGMFTLRELSYAECRPNPRETLGGLFAAKEAIRKADARYLDLPLTEIEVLPDSHGRPTFDSLSVSISHSGGFAAAAAAVGRMMSAPQAPPTAPVETGDAPPPPTRPGRGRTVARVAFVLYHGILLCGAVAFLALAVERLSGTTLF